MTVNDSPVDPQSSGSQKQNCTDMDTTPLGMWEYDWRRFCKGSRRVVTYWTGAILVLNVKVKIIFKTGTQKRILYWINTSKLKTTKKQHVFGHLSKIFNGCHWSIISRRWSTREEKHQWIKDGWPLATKQSHISVKRRYTNLEQQHIDK